MPVNYKDGKIYTMVNDVNDILYVGSTAQLRLISRMTNHNRSSKTKSSPLYIAMQKFGIEHFRIILHHAFPCTSRDELEAEEYRTMDGLIAAGKQLYNSIIGGRQSQEQRDKISAVHRGKPKSDSHKAKISCANLGNKKRFAFGSLVRAKTPQGHMKCVFYWYDSVTHASRSKAFSEAKYGELGALWRAEEVRRQIYPE